MVGAVGCSEWALRAGFEEMPADWMGDSLRERTKRNVRHDRRVVWAMPGPSPVWRAPSSTPRHEHCSCSDAAMKLTTRAFPELADNHQVCKAYRSNAFHLSLLASRHAAV
jgi:hypothetical protein